MQKSEIKKVLDDLDRHLPGDLAFDTGEKTYIRRFLPPQRLLLLGCGHISQALCRFASQVDFSVSAADDRIAFANSELFPDADTIICDSFENSVEQLKINRYDYVAVLTRGHRWDADCLRAIFKGELPAYLGLIGSKRRVRGLLDLLKEEGYEEKTGLFTE